MKLLTSIFICSFIFINFSIAQTEKPSTQITDDDKIFKDVDQKPRFSGCEDKDIEKNGPPCWSLKLQEFVYSNLKYPSKAKEKGIEGIVYIKFIIEKDGTISNSHIFKDIGGGCGEEAKRVIDSMPNWQPARLKDDNVRYEYNLPITFKLEQPTFEEEEIIKVVDEFPRFPGCEEIENEQKRKECAQTKMLQFIYSNVKYPAEARTNGIEGTVVVTYIIEQDGTITDAKILRDIGGGCGDEGLRVVSLMPKWIPGRQDEKPVRVQFNIPIRFRLESNRKRKKRERRERRKRKQQNEK